ncbi:MAG TPA: ATPase, partial [Nocardioides sp.]|nr:ATPase [Nocardioides sp.]
AILGDGVDRKELEADLRTAGVPVDARVVDGLLREGREHAQRRALEDEQRARIETLDVPTYELPRLSDGIDLGGLYELAADLIDQGMA